MCSVEKYDRILFRSYDTSLSLNREQWQIHSFLSQWTFSRLQLRILLWQGVTQRSRRIVIIVFSQIRRSRTILRKLDGSERGAMACFTYCLRWLFIKTSAEFGCIDFNFFQSCLDKDESTRMVFRWLSGSASHTLAMNVYSVCLHTFEFRMISVVILWSRQHLCLIERYLACRRK